MTRLPPPEWFANRVVLFRCGSHIFCTYGLFVGVGLALQVVATHAFAQRVAGSAAYWASALAPWVTVLGWRVCSVCIEDAHHLRAGRWATALRRPGYLEAGGHVFAMALALGIGGRAHGVALCDAVNAGYYLGLTFLKLGCVSYGCCWGVALSDKDAWYATRYVDADAKVVRLHPSMRGVPLFPVSSFMAVLFFKNAALCALLLTTGAYRVGAPTALLPLINALDKRLYFAKRGDTAADTGVDPHEDFRMVPAAEKRRYCQAWARWDAVPCALAWLSLLAWRPADASPETTAPSWPGASAAFALGAVSFGYHYGRCGCWCIQRSRVDAHDKAIM